MGIRFRKTIKLGNLVKLNISKSGVSATIGKKGASINIGGKGTYLNLSPSAAGLKGTGISYRTKLTGGYSGLLGKAINSITNKDESTNQEVNKVEESIVDNSMVDVSTIDEYKETLETNKYLYKYTDNVLNDEELNKRLESFDNDASKEIYKSALDGDEDTIESLVGAFLDNLDLSYDVKANYELEENILYVDLDLPEIENLSLEYPTLNKNEVILKKKTQDELKEEYAKTILSLGIYLTSNFFNITGFIKEIVLSGFSSSRNNDGDLVDQYLYSVKFNREIFEKTNLKEIDDPYNFVLKFENRINMSNAYSFKEIKPYEMASVTKTNSLIEEALEGLKELGYKVSDFKEIVPELEKMNLETSGEYLKEALKILKK